MRRRTPLLAPLVGGFSIFPPLIRSIAPLYNIGIQQLREGTLAIILDDEDQELLVDIIDVWLDAKIESMKDVTNDAMHDSLEEMLDSVDSMREMFTRAESIRERVRNG